jgi:hypothetical protein
VREVAVVDRIVDGERAVLLVGDPPTREVTAPLEALPAGAREGHWLEVEIEGDRLASATIDQRATERARDQARKKRDALRRRGRRR